MNSVKSIWVPMKSEISDSFNRHFWLHKTEYRLSQIRMVELDEQATIDELEVEGLVTVGSYFRHGHSSSLVGVS
ncbi:hypothetical protein V1505DRAFT_367910 [Lipomyces doorenjongii]